LIIVRITSGLGNQMYQYNFYKFIKERYPETTVKADVTWFYANDEHHGFELEKLFKRAGSDFELDIASTKEIYKVTGQVPNFVKGALAGKCQYLLGPVNRILREKIHPDFKCNKIDRLESERSDSFYEDVTNLDVTKDWYLFGYWIEEEYYKERLGKLKRELVFPDFADEANIATAKDMADSSSVSIHVRRGDYLSSIYSDKFLILGRDYYEQAVNYIKDKVREPRFFIFSDDAEFVKQEFDWLDNKTIITNNTGSDSFRDMQLMTRCKHNIIANSTFSQWGALLNDNAGHITVYPKAYMRNEDSQEKTTDGWVRI